MGMPVCQWLTPSRPETRNLDGVGRLCHAHWLTAALLLEQDSAACFWLLEEKLSIAETLRIGSGTSSGASQRSNGEWPSCMTRPSSLSSTFSKNFPFHFCEQHQMMECDTWQGTHLDAVERVQCMSGNHARSAHDLHATNAVRTFEQCLPVLFAPDAGRPIESAEAFQS